MDPSRLAVLSRWLGPAVAIVALGFVVKVLGSEWGMSRQALREASLGWIAAAAVLALAAMVAMALPWRRVLRLLGSALPLGQTVGLYFGGEIGKYLPGGFWPVVGRGELARRAGMSRSSAYASVALSLMALYLAATISSAVLLPMDRTGPVVTLVVVIIAAGCGVFALNPRVLGAILALASRLLRRPLGVTPLPWRSSLALVALYLPAWGLVGAATWCVARSFDPSAGLVDVASAAVLSWLAGFVVVGVPGGVGVREATFVAVAGGVDAGPAAATAVVARLLFVGADALGAVLALPGLRRAHLRARLGGGPSPSSTGADV